MLTKLELEETDVLTCDSMLCMCLEGWVGNERRAGQIYQTHKSFIFKRE